MVFTSTFMVRKEKKKKRPLAELARHVVMWFSFLG